MKPERAVDVAGERLVARAGGAARDEGGVPVVHGGEVGAAVGRHRAHEVHRRRAVGVRPDHPLRVGGAVAVQVVDGVAAVGLQPGAGLDVGAARLGVLARRAGRPSRPARSRRTSGRRPSAAACAPCRGCPPRCWRRTSRRSRRPAAGRPRRGRRRPAGCAARRTPPAAPAAAPRRAPARPRRRAAGSGQEGCWAAGRPRQVSRSAVAVTRSSLGAAAPRAVELGGALPGWPSVARLSRRPPVPSPAAPGARMPTTDVPGASGLRAHLSVPPVGSGPWPGVVVLHEVFGLTDDVRQQADRLAAAGYVAAAPDLYSRGGALRCLRSTFAAAVQRPGAGVRRHRGHPSLARRAPGRDRPGGRDRLLHRRRLRAARRHPRLRRVRAQLRAAPAGPGGGPARRLPGGGELRRARPGAAARGGAARARRSRRPASSTT